MYHKGVSWNSNFTGILSRCALPVRDFRASPRQVFLLHVRYEAYRMRTVSVLLLLSRFLTEWILSWSSVVFTWLIWNTRWDTYHFIHAYRLPYIYHWVCRELWKIKIRYTVIPRPGVKFYEIHSESFHRQLIHQHLCINRGTDHSEYF